MHQAQASPCPSPGRPGLDPMGEAREQQPGTPEKTGKPAKVRQGARETQGEPDHRSQSARPLPCHMGCHPHPAVSIRHLTWLCPFPQGPPRNNNTPIPPSSHPKQQPSHSVCTPYGTQEQQHQEQEHQAQPSPQPRTPSPEISGHPRGGKPPQTRLEPILALTVEQKGGGHCCARAGRGLAAPTYEGGVVAPTIASKLHTKTQNMQD